MSVSTIVGTKLPAADARAWNDEVDLDEAGGRIVPVSEGANGNRPPHHRPEAHAASTAAARDEPHRAQQPVHARRADRKQRSADLDGERQPAVPFLLGCAPVERKALLAALLAAAGCRRLVYVDHLEAGGDRLIQAVRVVGGEGIVAKRAAGRYRPGPGREWLKAKCCTVGGFVITSFRDSVPGKIEAVTVAEFVGDELRAAGEVRFGVGRALRQVLDEIRTGDERPNRPRPAPKSPARSSSWATPKRRELRWRD